MGAIKAPYSVTIEITEDADGWHLPTSEEYERRMKRREYIADFTQGKHGENVMPKQELIRCKNCRFFREQFISINGKSIPAHWCEEWAGNTLESGFCHLAERKKE